MRRLHTNLAAATALGALVALVALALGCRSSSIFNVESPVGEIPNTALNSPIVAVEAFAAARADFENALTTNGDQGLIDVTNQLSDQFTAQFDLSHQAELLDARLVTAAGDGSGGGGTGVIGSLLAARSNLLLSIPPLVSYASATDRGKIGEAYALVGYVEMLLAEDYCAGVTLSDAVLGGGVSFGPPLTVDSLLGTAQAHFESALLAANGDDTVAYLASVGLGRVLVDRGKLGAADTAITQVPTNFVYNLTGDAVAFNSDLLQPNLYNVYLYTASQGRGCVSEYNMSDREGGNGLNYISAGDPRLVVDSTLWETCDFVQNQYPDSVWYYPAKFGNPAINIPLASGVEAQLIAAEAALASGNTSTWLSTLNTLRTSGSFSVAGNDTIWALGTGQVPGQTTGLGPLADPGSDSGRVSLLFRERAFWLYGTGSRLGEMRRLISQYGRPRESVYPTGSYQPLYHNNPAIQLPTPIYGTDVDLALPPPSFTGNPYYKGCTTSTSIA